MKNKNSLSLVVRLTVAALLVLIAHAGFALDPKLSGQRELPNKDIAESAYNTNNGSLVFLLTPAPHGNDDQKSDGVAPLYIVVYPSAVSGVIGTMNCQHQPGDNCPDHGPVFAGLAESTVPDVYGNGIWGHDHIGPFPASKHGEKASFTWVPVAVMFKTMEAASHHITTIEQLRAAEQAGQVTEVVLWDAAFQAFQTTVNVYLRGTPVEPGPPTP